MEEKYVISNCSMTLKYQNLEIFCIVYDFPQMTLLLSQNNASDIQKFSASTILSCVDLFEIYANGFNCYVQNFRFIRLPSDTFKSIFGPYRDKKTAYNSVPESNIQPLITTVDFIAVHYCTSLYTSYLCISPDTKSMIKYEN